MAEKVHRIHSLPKDAPWAGGLPPVGSEEHPRAIRMLDRVLSVQRPVVLAHLRSIRLRHPRASVDEILAILERRYLAAVTTGGAAVGALDREVVAGGQKLGEERRVGARRVARAFRLLRRDDHGQSVSRSGAA